MTQRKWLAECHAWLDDPTSVQFQNVEGTWFSSCRQGWNPITHPHYLWRIKPKTIMLNGTELPKPVKFSDSINPCALLINTPDCRLQKTLWFNTREDRDAVYSKLMEVLGL
jgi:hypothetical protein